MSPNRNERLPRALRADLKRLLADPRFVGIPEPVLARAMTGWIHLFGLVSFELFGRFNDMITDTRQFFDYQVRAMGTQIGL